MRRSNNGSSPRQKSKTAKPGRPSSYDQKTAMRICDELALGKSLRSICERENMPDRATVYRWREAHPEFRDHYARARAIQIYSYVDEIIDIADNFPDLKRAKLMTSARRWTLGRLLSHQ